MNTNATIWVKFKVPGFHYWPEATGDRAYLASRHRHLFGYQVSIPAPVDNARSIEFHDLRDACDDFVRLCPDEWGNSCEVMAGLLAEHVLELHPHLEWCEVTVDEDGECGATVIIPNTHRPE